MADRMARLSVRISSMSLAPRRGNRPGGSAASHDRGLTYWLGDTALSLPCFESRAELCEGLSPWPLDQRYELALGIGVAIDVPLGCLDRSMPRKHLHIAQRPAGLVHQPGRASDERSPPGMGRAALKADGSICP